MEPLGTPEPNAEVVQTPQFFDVLSAIGNSENKALLFSSMKEDETYTQTELHRHHLAIQGDNPAWRMSISAPFSYAKTFADVGMVAKETKGRNAYPAYCITKSGTQHGVPLAGHLLNLSLEESPTLLAYAGQASTNAESGARTSQRRVEIMRLLVERGGQTTRIADVAEELGILLSTTSTITTTLAQYGLIGKESAGRGKASLAYSGNPEILNAEFRQDITTPFFYNLFSVVRELYETDPEGMWTNAEITETLIDRGLSDLPRNQLLKQVASKMYYLASSRNLLDTHRGVTSNETAREVIWGSDEQLRTMSKFVLIITGMQQPDATYQQQGKEHVTSILGDKDAVRLLINKSRTDSLGLKRLPDSTAETHKQLLGVLAATSSPLLIEDLRSLVGKRLDKKTVMAHLQAMVKAGKVQIEKTNSGFAYSVIDQPEGV